MTLKEFGKHVRTLRRDRNWSQDELSNIAKINVHVLRSIEHGTRKHIDADLLSALSNAFKFTKEERQELYLMASGFDNSNPGKSIKEKKLKVFLCHSSNDKSIVRKLYQRLIGDGFDAWLDEEKILPGQEWDSEIRRAVREVNVVLVCLSNSSISKAGYVQKEIRFALDIADEQPEDAIYLIPVRLEDCQVPNRLSRWQWVDLFEDRGYEKLSKALNSRAKNLGISSDSSLAENNVLEMSRKPYEPELAFIPAGRFIMGSNKEQMEELGVEPIFQEIEYPQHKVELSEFYIGKYLVTNREYQVFIQDVGYWFPKGWNEDQFPPGKENHPVINISWVNANAYCNWLTKKTNKLYRLPTEAEWEKAARGGDGRLFPWGNEFDNKLCNIDGQTDTVPIGKFSPEGDSPYGCADMVGSVKQWCLDWYNEREYLGQSGRITKNPTGPKTGTWRVMRGSYFDSYHWAARCSTRWYDLPDSNPVGFGYGFRIACSSKEKNY